MPDGGAQLSFWVTRDTEPDWDFAFVEAHTAGPGRLDDAARPQRPHHAGHRLRVPLLARASPVPRPLPSRRRRRRVYAHGHDRRVERRPGPATATRNGLSTCRAYAGSDVEVSISLRQRRPCQLHRPVRRRRHRVDRRGHDLVRGRRRHPRRLGRRSEPPRAATPTPTTGSPAPRPTARRPIGDIARGSLDREPEIVSFLSSQFGRYPWTESGGIVDDNDNLGFALETQTRPIYSKAFFSDSISGDSVVVHELAHQWFGDAWPCRPGRRSGSTRASPPTPSGCGASTTASAPRRTTSTSTTTRGPDRTTRSGTLTIGDPGPDGLFDTAVYYRGAMTLHAAAAAGRRPGVLPHAAALVPAQRRRQRDDRRSSSRWPSRPRARTWTRSSTRGCSRRASRRCVVVGLGASAGLAAPAPLAATSTLPTAPCASPPCGSRAAADTARPGPPTTARGGRCCSGSWRPPCRRTR